MVHPLFSDARPAAPDRPPVPHHSTKDRIPGAIPATGAVAGSDQTLHRLNPTFCKRDPQGGRAPILAGAAAAVPVVADDRLDSLGVHADRTA